MVNHCYIPTTSIDCPKITVTHGGSDEGFKLKSSWGTEFQTMILNEPTWGRIVTYFEGLPKSNPQAKPIPEDRYVVGLEESPPLVPKGSKLLRFTADIVQGLPQLWTLYFPPLPPTSADRFETRGDLATKKCEVPDTEETADSYFAAVAKQIGLPDGDAVRRKMAHYIGSKAERTTYPKRTDEEREHQWQMLTKWGKIKGIHHWSEHGPDCGKESLEGGSVEGQGGSGAGGSGSGGGGGEGGQANRSKVKDTAPIWLSGPTTADSKKRFEAIDSSKLMGGKAGESSNTVKANAMEPSTPSTMKGDEMSEADASTVKESDDDMSEA